ncbi:MAG: hypothetical protein DMG62_03275 [Acidobacteria bacterium]|nr:MAG: hypothetical protein DMG62_03275 [Acidobacteriota bacterium]
MACNTVVLTGKEQYLAQIEKIANSSLLHGSESLCKLLRYLARNAVDHPGAHPKEYQIATEVFGRSSDFDPQMDSTVRVQVGRLRQKLHEYYSSEGAEDAILVDLPKGSYALGLHHRGPAPLQKELESHVVAPVAVVAPSPRNWAIAVSVLSLLLAGAVAVIVAERMTSNKGAAAEASENYSSPALRVFWKAFLGAPQEPWVVFSNASFVGRPETGMRYLDPARDTQPKILDHYTGVGEVLAVHELDQVFATLHRQLRVKRGSLLSLDDVKNNNLIFVGSPAENLTLRDIPGTSEFVFRRLTDGPRKGDLAIASVHPQPGEPKQFLGTPNNLQLTDDYSVIALVKGLNPARSVLILAGTTTLGTQAAVEYVCRQSFVEQLLLRLSVSPTGELEPFEAVLHVRVTRGVPMETEVVALRKDLLR